MIVFENSLRGKWEKKKKCRMIVTAQFRHFRNAEAISIEFTLDTTNGTKFQIPLIINLIGASKSGITQKLICWSLKYFLI